MIQNSFINEIENEYKKIDNKWLKLHFSTAAVLVAFGFSIELILGIVIYQTGNVSISPTKYYLKYLAAPLGVNLLFLLIGYFILRSPRIKQRTKLYAVSMLFVAICFTFFTVHSIMQSLFFIFSVPMLLTIVYNDNTLTAVTTFASIIAFVVSDIFVVWDPDKIRVFDTDLGIVNFTVALCILVAFFAVCLVVISFERQKNSASIVKEIDRLQLQQKLLTDDLTLIYNRTALRNALDRVYSDSTGNKYIFVMCDLDNFKLLNDKHGHSTGDRCLKEFAEILKRNCGDATPFRFGGDEFCILFINQPLEAVITTCEKVQADLETCCSRATITVPLSASFGIAGYESKGDVNELLRNADSAMYRSKSMRNAITVYDEKYNFDQLSIMESPD